MFGYTFRLAYFTPSGEVIYRGCYESPHLPTQEAVRQHIRTVLRKTLHKMNRQVSCGYFKVEEIMLFYSDPILN